MIYGAKSGCRSDSRSQAQTDAASSLMRKAGDSEPTAMSDKGRPTMPVSTLA